MMWGIVCKGFMVRNRAPRYEGGFPNRHYSKEKGLLLPLGIVELYRRRNEPGDNDFVGSTLQLGQSFPLVLYPFQNLP